MRRKLFAVVFAALLATTVFIGTSYAISAKSAGAADFPPNLPVSQLPTEALPADLQSQISNLLGTETSTQFGISAESYAHVRRLATTSAGALYAIPGARGQCLVLWPAASCGNVGQGEATVSLLVPNPEHRYLVGGGILGASHGPVDVVRDDGSSTSVTIIRGGFVVSEAQAVEPGINVAVAVR
jgi:hypothetical protein